MTALAAGANVTPAFVLKCDQERDTSTSLPRSPHPPFAANPSGEAVVEVALMTGSDGEEDRGEASPTAPSARSAPLNQSVASPSASDRGGTEADVSPDGKDHVGFAGASDDVGTKRTPAAAESPEDAGAPSEAVPLPMTGSVSPQSPEIEAPRAEPTVESPTKSRSEASSRNRIGRGAAETRSPKRPQKSSSPPANGERQVTARGAATAANDRSRPGTPTVKQSGGSASDLARFGRGSLPVREATGANEGRWAFASTSSETATSPVSRWFRAIAVPWPTPPCASCVEVRRPRPSRRHSAAIASR